MKIAFYKGKYSLVSYLIRFWTRSKYSHCEFYDGNALIGISNDGGVRKLDQPLNPKKWDVYDINIDSDQFTTSLEEFYQQTKGCKYDIIGLICSNFFGRGIHIKDRYTCSEWCANALDSFTNTIYPKDYIKITPGSLHQLMLVLGYIEEKSAGDE